MESGRPLHYDGNTVIVPKLSLAKKKLREKAGFGGLIKPEKTPQNRNAKVCASMQCPWCDTTYDEYRAVCTNCGNCFYCGLQAHSTYECQICNNVLPESERLTQKTRVIRLA